MTKSKDELQRERQLERLKNDLTWIMSTASGRRVLGGILHHGGVFLSSFQRAAGANDVKGTTEFYEGMRYLALMLYNDLRAHTPEQLNLMMKETDNENRRKTEPSA